MNTRRRFLTAAALTVSAAFLRAPGHVLAADPAAPANPPPPQPSNEYGTRAREVMAYLQANFVDPKSGLYVRAPDDRKPDYIWRQAAAFSALVGATRHEPQTYLPLLARHFKAMEVYWDAKAPIHAYEPAPTKGNGHDKYYDDNAWLVITLAEAFQLTGNRGYLTRAEETARFVASGWDDKLGGGIWWHEAHHDDSKNTCANGPGAVGYLYLARLGPRGQAKEWLEKAAKTVEWTQKHLQDPTDGLYDDRIVVTTGEVKRGKLTYNSALMLRANLNLYRQTGEERYLRESERIAKGAEWFIDKKTGEYRDPMKWSQFMAEADIDLYRTTGDERWLTRARTAADAYYQGWRAKKSPEMMVHAGIARVLWLLADLETDKGRAFWAEFGVKPKA